MRTSTADLRKTTYLIEVTSPILPVAGQPEILQGVVCSIRYARPSFSRMVIFSDPLVV